MAQPITIEFLKKEFCRLQRKQQRIFDIIEKNNVALVKKCDEYRDEYNKMVKAKGDRIKDLQMRLDRANDTIEEMVESRREFLDV